MDRITLIWNQLRNLFHRRRLEEELRAELRHHIELETEKNIREGMSPREAGTILVIQPLAQAAEGGVAVVEGVVRCIVHHLEP